MAISLNRPWPPFPVGIASGVAFFAVAFVELENQSIEFLLRVAIMFPFLRAGLVSVIAYKASVGEKASKRDETDSEIFRAMAKNFFVLFIGVAASLFPLAIAYGLLTDKM